MTVTEVGERKSSHLSIIASTVIHTRWPLKLFTAETNRHITRRMSYVSCVMCHVSPAAHSSDNSAPVGTGSWMHLDPAAAATVLIVLHSFCSAMQPADNHGANYPEVRRAHMSGGDTTTTASASCAVAGACSGSTPHDKNSKSRSSRPRLSRRVRETEPAHIEAVLLRYANMIPPPANLAQV